jgi:hypothetical protein
LEYTSDGHIFYPLTTVQASGNSEIPIDYTYDDKRKWETQIYYRITSVDLDGKLDYSDLISAFNCSVDSKKLITNVHAEDGTIAIHFADKSVCYQIVDLNGQAITEVLNNEEKSENQIITSISQGVYILKSWNKQETVFENQRFFISR